MLFMECHFIGFVFKQKTAYEMRISDWSSDVCSSDLSRIEEIYGVGAFVRLHVVDTAQVVIGMAVRAVPGAGGVNVGPASGDLDEIGRASCRERVCQYV